MNLEQKLQAQRKQLDTLQAAIKAATLLNAESRHLIETEQDSDKLLELLAQNSKHGIELCTIALDKSQKLSDSF